MNRQKLERFCKSEKAGTRKLFRNFKPLVKVILRDEVTSRMNAKQCRVVFKEIRPYFSEVARRIIPQGFAVIAPRFRNAWIGSESFQRVTCFDTLATVGAIFSRDQGDVGQLAKL